jgi:uncharacterized protein (DUF302 family)
LRWSGVTAGHPCAANQAIDVRQNACRDETLPIKVKAMTQPLGFQVNLDLPFQAAIEKVTQALQEQGFGVLTRIDVQATLKEKLGKDFRPYVILGACNPPLAHRALEEDTRVGLLLPCNVTVEQIGEGVLVSIANPEALLTVGVLAENGGVCGVAAEARARLERAAESLRR